VKALLVCSSGGHLLLLQQLRPWWEQQDRTWVTFRKTDAMSLLEGERVHWAHYPTQRSVRNLLKNLRLAWRVLSKE
jgi:beta-1,4-N-acetylglucosaminyltransferase